LGGCLFIETAERLELGKGENGSFLLLRKGWENPKVFPRGSAATEFYVS
jgi:hypothetical protein